MKNNCVILSFNSNWPIILGVKNGKSIVVNKALPKSAEYLGKDEHGRLEIQIDLFDFINIKERRDFERLCCNVSRCRTTTMWVLIPIVYGIRGFDNDLRENEAAQNLLEATKKYYQI